MYIRFYIKYQMYMYIYNKYTHIYLYVYKHKKHITYVIYQFYIVYHIQSSAQPTCPDQIFSNGKTKKAQMRYFLLRARADVEDL